MTKSSEPAEEPDDTDKDLRSPDPVDVKGCRPFRLRRLLLRLNQDEQRDKRDPRYRQIQNLEKGTNRIGASCLFNIAHVLGVSAPQAPSTAPGQFGEGDQANEWTQTAIAKFLRSREGLELNSAFERIAHTRTRRAIVELVRTVANRDASNERQFLSVTRLPARRLRAIDTRAIGRVCR